MKLKNDAAESIFKYLIKNKLIVEQPAAGAAARWRETADGQHMTLVITPAGLKAIGADAHEAKAPERGAARPGGKSGSGKPQSPKLHRSPTGRLARGRVVARSDDASLPGPRPDSKQAKVIELLGRPQGASVAEMMKATGWQAHSVRGVMSGALKKKLSLGIVSEKTEAGERRYRIAK